MLNQLFNRSLRTTISRKMFVMAAAFCSSLVGFDAVAQTNAKINDVCSSTTTGNLICNSSFDSRNSGICSNIISFGASGNLEANCNRWSASGATPDYFGICDVQSSSVINWIGTQTARTGNYYAGLVTIHRDITTPANTLPNYSEYIGQRLAQPLLPNRQYYSSFYTSLSDKSAFATNIGMAVEDTIPPAINANSDACGNNSLVAKISTNAAIIDTINWTKVSGVFNSKGGEKFVLIGLFGAKGIVNMPNRRPNWNIDRTGHGTGINPDQGAYYYIDDVSLILLPLALDSTIASNCGASVTIGTTDASALSDSVKISWTATAGGITTNLAATTASITVNPLVTTVYTRTITIDGAVVATSSSTVIVNIPLTPVISGNASFCSGSGNSTTLSVVNPLENLGVTYLWSNNTTGTSLTATAAGNYSVRVIANGCTSAVSNVIAVTVTTVPAPVMSRSGSFSFCGGEGNSLLVSVVNADTTRFRYIWYNVANSTNHQFLGSGPSYSAFFSITLRVKAISISSACTSAYSREIVTLKAPPKPNPSSILRTGTLACGGSVTLSVPSGIGDPRYFWERLNSNGTNTTIGTTSSSSITISTPGVYRVIVSSYGNCFSNPDTITVTDGIPVISATDTTICTGGTTKIEVSNPVVGTTYTWSNGAVGNSITVNLAGTYTVRAGTCTSAVSNPIIVTIGSPTVTFAPASLAPGFAGTLYHQTITQTVLNSPTFSIVSGGLPAGITLSAAGTLSGTTNAVGTFNFTVQATAATADKCSGTKEYSLVIGTCPTFTFTPAGPGLASAAVNSPYSPQTISVQGLNAPITFVVSTGALPTGLTLNPSTGVISGTPTLSGTFSFVVKATAFTGNCAASNCNTASKSYTLTVTCNAGTVSPNSPSISIPVNVPYTRNPAFSGSGSSMAGATVRIVSGSLPTGLSLVNNVLSGTPTKTGSFTVRLVASTGQCSTKEFPFTINVTCPTATIPTPVIAGASSFCQGDSTTLSVSNAVTGMIYLWNNGVVGNSITVSQAGCYNVQAISCVSPVSSSFEVTTSSCGARLASKEEISLNLFPNPSTGVVNLQLAGAEKATYEVYSVVGERIATGTVTNEAATLDMNNHPAGMYLVKVRTGKEVITKQLVINR